MTDFAFDLIAAILVTALQQPFVSFIGVALVSAVFALIIRISNWR